MYNFESFVHSSAALLPIHFNLPDSIQYEKCIEKPTHFATLQQTSIIKTPKQSNIKFDWPNNLTEPIKYGETTRICV